jgi:hypothetical protein
MCSQLYVKSYSDEQQGTRTKATLAAISTFLLPASEHATDPSSLPTGEALVTSLEPLPDVEFVLQTGDTGLLAGAPWVLGRKEKEDQLTLMPGALPL